MNKKFFQIKISNSFIKKYISNNKKIKYIKKYLKNKIELPLFIYPILFDFYWIYLTSL